MKSSRRLLVILLLLGVLAGPALGLASEPRQTTLLTNPSFEDP
jgi:hypothetical protein